MKLKRSFYKREDVAQIARELLGKSLHTCINGIHTAGKITEVEAYSGRNDKACHANDGLRTKRTEIMYGKGGVAYMYLCYGIHHLFNVVTNNEGFADAVLIRAVEPILGFDKMIERRNHTSLSPKLSSGPGTLTKALGLNTEHYGEDLLENLIWIEDAPVLSDVEIITSKRIGVDYAEEDASKPWRFYIKNSKWISKK